MALWIPTLPNLPVAQRLFRRRYSRGGRRRPIARAVHSLTVIFVVFTLPSCGDNPVAPDPPGPTLACPVDLEAQSHNGQPATVDFTRPVPQGGIAPVNVSCSPAPGAGFPIGTNTVTCTARDAKARIATCSFLVVVSAVPRISELTFLAFGDSLTEGKTSPDPTTLLVNFPESYPNKLQALLSARYLDQTITVIPDGRGGERVSGDGEERFPLDLDTFTPDVALVLHGANDLLAAGDDPHEAIEPIIDALEAIIRAADERGVAVMLATLPPQDPEGSRGDGAPAVPDLNRAIRRLARNEGAVLVDLFNGLGGTPVGSVGVDGLHLTASGYAKVAQLWFDAIQDEYEVPVAGAPTLQIRVDRNFLPSRRR